MVLPGLINIAAFVVPGVATRGSQDFAAVTKASIAAGFSMIRIMPLGLDCLHYGRKIVEGSSGQQQTRSKLRIFNLSIAATSTNAEQISQVTSEVGSLFIPFNHLSDNISKVATVTAHFDAWPTYKPIITDAKMTDLASILSLASLHSRKVHVTSVTTRDDIKLIALSKEKGLKVTCDVSVYALFLSQDQYPKCSFLPTVSDQKALWEYLTIIDVFAVGSLPYQLAHAVGVMVTPAIGIADTLPLLFSAVADGKLTVDDIRERLHDNPIEIFRHQDHGAGTARDLAGGGHGAVDTPLRRGAAPSLSHQRRAGADRPVRLPDDAGGMDRCGRRASRRDAPGVARYALSGT